MKPFLRWAGSKQQLLPLLRQYWPPDAFRYIEPFVGSACLFFDLQPRAAVLGDLNSELIRTFRAIKSDIEAVIRQIRRLPTGEQAYYAIRRIDPGSQHDSVAAARFLYLNWHCFNGLYRTNVAGEFNVPFGHNKSSAGIDFDRLRIASGLLRKVRLVSGDFVNTLQSVSSGDFVYMDPPYTAPGRRIFSEYLPGSFGRNDLARLCRSLEMIHRRGARFLLTYAYSRCNKAIFRDWFTRRVRVRRNIAGFCSKRRGTYELLVSNFEPI